jgi:hypothetical protein
MSIGRQSMSTYTVTMGEKTGETVEVDVAASDPEEAIYKAEWYARHWGETSTGSTVLRVIKSAP